MKKIFFVMLMLCCALGAVAQQIGFTYQAVALDESKAEGFGRDSKGQILLNQPLKVRFSIREQSADGTVQYQEVHETTTDIFGIFRVVIGSGEKLLGTSLETLQWSDQSYFMQVELDLGNGFINMGEEIIVVPPFGLNNSVQLLNLSGTQITISEGNSVDLSNLLGAVRLSEQEVDAYVANNGYLLTEVDGSVTNELQSLSSNGTAGYLAISNGNEIIVNVNDADADPLNEIQDLQLVDNQLSISNNANATAINLSPYLGSNLTEEEVDAMVANNGYLTAETDGSVTNEIQDLNLNGNNLTITNYTNATSIDLSPYQNIFERTGEVISNENGTYASDNFVFGSPLLNNNGNVDYSNRFLFDKASGAFRSGGTTDDSWDASKRGTFSTAVGFNTQASGDYSVAGGNASRAEGESSFAIGHQSVAWDDFSIALGNESITNGVGSVAIGNGASTYSNNAVAIGNTAQAYGNSSVSIGFNNVTHAPFNTALGFENNSWSYGETIMGMFALDQEANPTTFSFAATDKLFSIGNGSSDLARSNALVIRKNGNTQLNGQLTIDADNLIGTGEQYTLPGQDGAANQVMTTDGNGNVSWNTPTTLAESDVDTFVSNNGYLTTEVDGSITNEIQDLNLIGNTLSITNNTAPTNIDLTPYQNVFETTNNVTSNENGNYANDDFVFGSPQLADDGDATHDRRMFFDKSKGAFRAGTVTGTQWNDANVGESSLAVGEGIASGLYSVAFGRGIASGANSFAMISGNASGIASVAIGAGTQAVGGRSMAFGGQTVASGTNAVAFGELSQATGNNSVAFGWNSGATGEFSYANGYDCLAQGQASFAHGWNVHALGHRSLAIGFGNDAIGSNSVALGAGTRAYSDGETSLGLYNTEYTPTNSYTDRHFVVGNGVNVSNRSDALIILKNGNTRLHGQLTIDADNINGAGGSYTLPGQRGTNGQTLITDGSGNVSWSTPSTLTEADVDNFVSNNGYLTSEIQDLNLTGNTLSITNNAAPTNIDLTPYQNVFETTNGVTSNENGSYTTDSFVIGSPSLDDDGDATHDTRMFFEKSTGAFRVGTVTDTRWDAAERGSNSVAMGLGNIARGGSSLSLGQNNLAHSASSVAIGTNNVAEGYNSVALGRNVATTGVHSMALSLYSASRSYGETTMGIYAVDYAPNSTTNFDTNDRLFTIGNGLDDGNRSNAFVILKNGDATLLGILTDASDMRLKRNIKPLQNSLLSLNNLQGVHYQWNGRKPQDTLALQTGLIAQEVEKIFPELVKTDEEGFKSVNYIGLVPHLIEAIKELKQENEILKSETEKTKISTKQKIAEMEAKLMRIEALVEKVKH